MGRRFSNMIMPLSVKNQSVESSGITKDYKEALCEYVWNGFEANATEVRISYTLGQMEGIDSVIVSDNGSGINYNELSDTFGAFLTSQKNNFSLKLKSKSNKGKGRFSFTAFSSLVKWKTNYIDDGVLKTYTITLSNENKEQLEYSDSIEIDKNNSSGTTVSFYNIYGIYPADLESKELEDYLLYEFAWYLYLNRHKNFKVFLNDKELDYSKHIDASLSETVVKTIDNHVFEISLIVWAEKIKEKFRSYYFDSNHTVKGIDTTTFNRNTVDFNHSVFVQAPFFDDWDTVSLFDASVQLDFFTDESKIKVLKKLKAEIQKFIGSKIAVHMSSKADEEIDKMMRIRKTFPEFPNDEYGDIRKKDMIRVTKELYCLEPRIFHKLKDIQERSLLAFLKLLLSSEERENVLTAVEQIVQLTTEQRTQFASILKKTHLENIIDTIAFVENRYRIIEILKRIIFDLGNYANERDHIQKIVEQNYWLFGEQFNLASADKTMHRALEQYNYLLYGAKNATQPLPQEAEAERRMDIFLCNSRNVETAFGSYIEENIIVELKAPTVRLNKTVLRQIEDYMDFIRDHAQFNSSQRRWKFIAVCKEVDDHVKAQYDTFKDRGKPGLVYQSGNYEIYAYTWSDVFTSFDLRHSFMLNKLKYDRNVIVEELKKDHPDQSRDTVNALRDISIAN